MSQTYRNYDLPLSSLECQKSRKCEDVAPLILSQLEKVLVASHDNTCIASSRTFQVAIIRRVTLDDRWSAASKCDRAFVGTFPYEREEGIVVWWRQEVKDVNAFQVVLNSSSITWASNSGVNLRRFPTLIPFPGLIVR